MVAVVKGKLQRRSSWEIGIECVRLVYSHCTVSLISWNLVGSFNERLPIRQFFPEPLYPDVFVPKTFLQAVGYRLPAGATSVPQLGCPAELHPFI